MLLREFLLLLVLVTKHWTFAGHIGIAFTASAAEPPKVCLSIRNSSLAAGSVIRLINPTLPQTELKGSIVGPDPACTGAPGGEDGLHYYAIQVAKAPASPMAMIAVSGFSGPFRKKGDLLLADLEADGHEESFRFCTSSEGIHFTVWTGPPLEGKIRWHQYYYLGYDVEPTCTPKEIGE